MEKKFRDRCKRNIRFKTKVKWYKLGQRRCHCCGVQLNWISGHKNSASVEHIVPASKGGTFHFENMLITCESCNNKRQDTDWIKFVTKNKFPKGEWLIEKYLKAVNYYRDGNNQRKHKKVHDCIFKNVDSYLLKKAE